jgi:hypothetical protein
MINLPLLNYLLRLRGLYFNKFIEGNKLKKGFGWFVLIMGVSIVLKEII